MTVGLLLLSSPIFEPQVTDRALLDAALEALSQDDPGRARELLFGWATRTPRISPPPGLERLGREALNRAAGVSHLHLFASRQADGLKVGLTDPSRLVDRIEVYAQLPSGERLLIPEQGFHGPGRWLFAVPTDRTLQIVVQALTVRIGYPLVMAEVRLTPWEDGPPGPPGVDRDPVRKSFDSSSQNASELVTESTWWWWIVAGLAVGLVGGALWQETRSLGGP